MRNTQPGSDGFCDAGFVKCGRWLLDVMETLWVATGKTRARGNLG